MLKYTGQVIKNLAFKFELLGCDKHLNKKDYINTASEFQLKKASSNLSHLCSTLDEFPGLVLVISTLPKSILPLQLIHIKKTSLSQQLRSTGQKKPP